MQFNYFSVTHTSPARCAGYLQEQEASRNDTVYHYGNSRICETKKGGTTLNNNTAELDSDLFFFWGSEQFDFVPLS